MTKPFRVQVEETRLQEETVRYMLSVAFNCEVSMSTNGNPYYDGTMTVDNKSVTYELKDDRNKCRKTGNHFLEIESRKKNSGIMITKADYWIVQPDNKILLMTPTSAIRRGIVDNIWTQVGGGDYEKGKPTSIGILVPLDWIENHAQTKIIKVDKNL